MAKIGAFGQWPNDHPCYPRYAGGGTLGGGGILPNLLFLNKKLFD